MERRRQLEERRITLNEEFDERWSSLHEEGLDHEEFERKREVLERRQQRRHEEIDE